MSERLDVDKELDVEIGKLKRQIPNEGYGYRHTPTFDNAELFRFLAELYDHLEGQAYVASVPDPHDVYLSILDLDAATRPDKGWRYRKWRRGLAESDLEVRRELRKFGGAVTDASGISVVFNKIIPVSARSDGEELVRYALAPESGQECLSVPLAEFSVCVDAMIHAGLIDEHCMRDDWSPHLPIVAAYDKPNAVGAVTEAFLKERGEVKGNFNPLQAYDLRAWSMTA